MRGAWRLFISSFISPATTPLIAQTCLSQAGLTGGGNTTNFNMSYEDSLPNQSVVIANANALLGVIENEFTVTTGWFNTPAGKFSTRNRQQVYVNQAANTGAFNNGYGQPIQLDSQDVHQ